MRRMLVERARKRQSVKHGGGRKRVDLEDAELGGEVSCEELLALDEALARLERDDARRAEVVKLRFFGGLTNSQAAQVLGISSTTGDSYWAYAKCWLRLEISGDGHR